MKRATKTAIPLIMLIFMVFYSTISSAGNYEYRCSDQKLERCDTSTNNGQIFIGCSWPVLSTFKTYTPGHKDPDPPHWDAIQGSYRCEYDTNNDGVRRLVCRDI